ncbi:hypothetical Protein YC6258_03493 [Gynuella sunshinyii YC6258]|uniref:Uncharacterized protein n=1 Tax=Gynuella sunshinyii YC6258 TaxID=1445510 RepID=A0A0C5VYP5_9GAMM|nr:hypothetical Protein YC6258_03493 [Gynuella sunshinyii YC6258]
MIYVACIVLNGFINSRDGRHIVYPRGVDQQARFKSTPDGLAVSQAFSLMLLKDF